MKHLRKFESFITEKLGINKDVEAISNYLHKIIKNRTIVIEGSDIPVKLTKPINKIVVNMLYNQKREAAFNVTRSKLTERGWDLYFEFKPNPSPDLIFHEVNHAFKFIMMGKEKSLKELNKIIASNKSWSFLPGNLKSEKLNIIVELIYYLDNSEIDSMITGTYADIKELSKESKIDKSTFIELVNSSEPMKISKFVDNLNLESYLSDIPKETKKLFFALLKEHESRLKKAPELTFIEKIKSIIKDIFSGTSHLKDDDLDIQIRKWDKYFHLQATKLKRKIWRTWDLI